MDLSTTMFTDSEMFKEADRIKTFDKWPVYFISNNALAAAGFYFLGRHDWFRCPFYGVQIVVWELGDDPLSCRRRWAPSCIFARGYFTHNVPIGS
jgi:hypothetical protein